MTPALIFDLDGTLVDSAADIARAINAMLDDDGLAPLPVETIERFTGEGASVLVGRVLAIRGLGTGEEEVRRATDRYLRHYAERPCERSTLFADAAEALPRFRAAGVALGVCTNKPEKLAITVLDILGVAHLFGAIIGADTTTARKPDPLPLRHTLRILGVEPASAILVGDTAIDRDTAEAAGVHWRIVGWHRSGGLTVPSSSLIHRFADLADGADRAA